ncbi:MAG: acyl-CoA/acyl-ACP dehydrogenase [Nocardioides sp.]|nr:acyl-CoA/acyl-ACP dehydrogenase [Nocardioides sp.]
MDFEMDDDRVAVRDLAEKIFTDRATVDRVVDVETNHTGFDGELWQLVADSGLIGIAINEDDDGAGLGALGMVTLLEQQGRRVAPLPLWSVIAGAALPLSKFGSAELKARWLPGLIDGSAPIAAAVDAAPGQLVTVRAEREGDSLVLHGEVASVPGAPIAAALVVPVDESGSPRLVVVPTDADGVTVTPHATTDRTSHGAVRLDGVRVAATEVVAEGDEALAWTLRRLRLALAAVQLGVCEEALRMTAAYTSERVQFGRPLSTNQAVAVRAADAHLDTEAIRLTVHRAAWLLDEGREAEAESATLVAKWWASRGGLRVVHATQHLHGGMGADVDYPIHRYFLWGRQLAFTMGTADALAAELGEELPGAPAIGAPA